MQALYLPSPDALKRDEWRAKAIVANKYLKGGRQLLWRVRKTRARVEVSHDSDTVSDDDAFIHLMKLDEGRRCKPNYHLAPSTGNAAFKEAQASAVSSKCYSRAWDYQSSME